MERKYPIGIQTFSEVIEGKYQYVDKTGYVFSLANKYKYVFLSRPRRFGKSLLISTFQSYFEGRKELFEGLEAIRLETEWIKHPVLHFDMSTAKHMDSNRLVSELNYKLIGYERIYGKGEGEEDSNQRLIGLIQRAYEQTGQKVVVLIDEYDAPLLDVLNEDEALKESRQIMRNFYSPLKACDPYLRFVFITGITKFSQLSIFSELNNLKNISMIPEYAGICGITSEELQTQLEDDVNDFAMKTMSTCEDAITKLRNFYDGYHFSEASPDIYNPYSLINALSDGKLESYWFTSGTPTYLIGQIRKFHVNPQNISETMARKSDFDIPTENMKSITPLLYQSGYITIKDYDPVSMMYTLAIPNREVRSGLMECLVPYVASDEYATPASILVGKMQRAFYDDNIESVMEQMKIFFSSIPYSNDDPKNLESFYQKLLYVVFSMLCQYTDVEVRTPKGRADLVINSRNKIYIIEVKINKDADFALNQINLRSYGERFLIQGKPIVKVGVNFDSGNSRNITDWKIIY